MALILVLIMTSLLFLMVLTLITLFRGEIFSSQSNLSRVSSLYLAEAGVAESMLALEANPAWTGVTGQTVPGIAGGAYTVDFAASAPELTSVNNLANASWGTSYHGANTVPPYSALLIVQANVNGTRRNLEVVVTRGTALPSMNNPVLASGRVLMGGNVAISGVTSLTDSTPVPAGIHSNVFGNVPDAVKWVGSGTDTAVITGSVSTTSTAGAAIAMGSATIAGGTQSGAAPEALPNIDIVGTISSKGGSPPPAINGSGVTTLAPGDYYYAGDLNINGGDLRLQSGANLYVSGKLTVNGSIRGEGSVYVGDETRFKGDSSIMSMRGTNNVAVFSHGSLYLEGFNGTDYIDGLVSGGDATLGTLWSESKTVLGALQNRLNNNTPANITAGGSVYTEIDDMRRALGQSNGATWNGHQNDLLYKMARRIESTQSPSTSRDFVIKKFDELDHLYDGKNRMDNFTDNASATPNTVVRDDWDNATYALYGGWFDNMIDNNYTAQLAEMTNITNNVDLNNLGSSYFQGMVYTNGFLHASNGVTVTGAVVARDDGTQATAVVNGQSLRPGDLFFDNDVKVTFVKDLFDGTSFVTPSNNLTVTTWMGR